MSLYALPPGVDFAHAFAEGFWARFRALPPAELARIQIWVNNRRSLRAIEDTLALSAGRARLLPRLSVVSEIGTAPLAVTGLPGAIDQTRRQLRLTRLVERFLMAGDEERTAAPPAAAADLALSLATLIDEFDEAGVPLAALDHATDGEHAAHWARNLAFLEVIRSHWPAMTEELEGSAPGPKARQRRALSALLSGWQAAPPSSPVLVAASTGSIQTTAELMAAVAGLPNGHVILPGFERDLEPEIWDRVASGEAPEHPAAPFRQVLQLTGRRAAEALSWVAEPAINPRRTLLGQAMRPAPVTDAWHLAAPALAADLPSATEGLALIEAPSPRHEAGAIALATRHALTDPDRKVLILTPSAALARRIAAALAGLGVDPDDSLGRPLAQSTPGVFLRLIADVAARPADPVRLAGLLQHPLMQPGMERGPHLGFARRFERVALRKRWQDQRAHALPDWPDAGPEDATWHNALAERIDPLAASIAAGASLSTLVEAHITAAEALSCPTPDAPPAVWAKEAGAAAQRVMARIASAADAYGPDRTGDYPSLLLGLMRSEEIRPDAVTPHPRVTLLSPREARVAHADLTILAGLNEGTWPSLPGEDPWLSRPMRANLGLPSPERRIGLAAHDFLQAAAGRDVLMTRAVKEDGTPTVASRWLIRLETLIAGIDAVSAPAEPTMQRLRARGAVYLDHLYHVDRPAAPMPRAPRPSPTPPVGMRPTQLAVTAIETLVRDPYAVYARHILRLRPMDALDQGADYRDRGTLIHEILTRFADAAPGPLPENAESLLLETADRALAEQISQPELRRVWRARVQRFAPWFLKTERQRRADLRQSFSEIEGHMTLTQPPGFVLTARADRIDLLQDGSAAIYDYKAGAPPSPQQIKSKFNQQLHLQAAILAAGGFEGLPAALAERGAYLGLTGSGEGGKETPVDALQDEIAPHMAELSNLLTRYADPAMGYTARRAVTQETHEGDYDHLARFGEWEAGDG
ncbi:MAG: double-strand break repair protein AddB [Pseudomonadota bacterium]